MLISPAKVDVAIMLLILQRRLSQNVVAEFADLLLLPTLGFVLHVPDECCKSLRLDTAAPARDQGVPSSHAIFVAVIETEG
jgi:hypothetical protein